MKQGKKWMLVALALLALVTVALPLVGCKHDADEAHTHSFDETKWEIDATGHWHPATCEHTDLKGSFAAHSYDWKEQTSSTDETAGKLVKKCTVCGHEGTETKVIPVGCVYVKGGTVEGSLPPWSVDADDKGVFVDGRTVTLSDFFIGRHEVTQELYKAVMTGQTVTDKWGTEHTLNATPSNFTSSPYGSETQEKRPVEKVSWYDAVYFCNELSKEEGLRPAYNIKVADVDSGSSSIIAAEVSLEENANGYRLPTEAEWEYAARGGKPNAAAWEYQYAGGNTIDTYAWYSGTTGVDNKTHEVGKKTANSLGIHDMSGNVFEWCWDWLDEDPKAGDPEGTSPVEDPTGPASGSSRGNRGGSWNGVAKFCGVSYRYYGDPNSRGNNLGFRVVRPAN